MDNQISRRAYPFSQGSPLLSNGQSDGIRQQLLDQAFPAFCHPARGFYTSSLVSRVCNKIPAKLLPTCPNQASQATVSTNEERGDVNFPGERASLVPEPVTGMAPILHAQTVERMMYLFFRTPHTTSTCFFSASLSTALPLDRTDPSSMCAFSKSPMHIMHCLRSLFLSAVAFSLFEYNIDGVPTTANTSPSSLYNTRFAGVTWDEAAWQIRTTVLDQGHFQARQSIANGYLGINVAAVLPGFEVDVQVDGDNINGWREYLSFPCPCLTRGYRIGLFAYETRSIALFTERQTFATIAGFYDSQPTTNGTNFPWLNQYGGESVISGVPHWSSIIVDLGNGVYLDATVDPKTIKNFASTLNAKTGVSTWFFTWSPEGSVSFDITYTMFAHKLYVNQAFVQLQIKPSADIKVSIANVIDGRSAVRTTFVTKNMEDNAIYTAVKPNNINYVTAYIYAIMDFTAEVDGPNLAIVTDKQYIGVNDSSIAQAVDANLKAGKVTVINKYIGGATTDGFQDPQGVARDACANALQTGFDKSLAAHMQEWATVMPEDFADNYTDPETGALPADPYIVELGITGVLSQYYLLQNTISPNALQKANNADIDKWSIMVGGLASDSYAGLIFWDAEIWMQPGLAASHPQATTQIAKYRVDHYDQAKKNAQTGYQSSKNKTSIPSDAAVYSWTSGRYGNCTGTGPCFGMSG